MVEDLELYSLLMSDRRLHLRADNFVKHSDTAEE